MREESQSAILSVRFDADQASSQLQWVLKDPNGDPRVQSGTNAGAIHFHQGESLSLEVTGGASKASGFTSFQIIDCCIITLPQIASCGPGLKTRYARPSPFLQSAGAVYPLALDFSATLDQTDESYRQITQAWKQTLDVGHSSGRWELSFIITVLLFRAAGEPAEERVFQFDPESAVGNGTRTN
ncbi:hypothetical protein AAKU55_000307 [Oxalobacteraceae bacterium GrIS 1.11]